jgi:DNA-directed RNA polymerase specialized sigma24 family protein
MAEADDSELLQRYAKAGSEEAFATLVARYVNLVYSAGLRKTGDPHAAEEIAQAVFIILARKADRFRQTTVLSGWMYQTARLTTASFLRTERRITTSILIGRNKSRLQWMPRNPPFWTFPMPNLTKWVSNWFPPICPSKCWWWISRK